MYYTFEKRNLPFVAAGDIIGLNDMPHIHPELEVIYLTSGSCYAVADGKEDFLDTGDLYISFPNQIHYYLDASKVTSFLIIVSPDLFGDLKGIFAKKIPTSPVIKKADLPNYTRALLDKICECLNSSDKLLHIAANGYMQSLLSEVLQKMELIDSPVHHDSVKNILLYCLENYTEPLTLDILSKKLYLSRYYISHIFTDRLKLSFPDFINGLRIEHACRILSKGCNITDVAFASGFSSVRSFNRNFEQNMGLTPTEYIKQKHR